jgi:adenine-specific DNA methylase
VTKAPPRLLIEDWLPAAAIGVECIRERSTGQQPPDKRLHVWWARRPLCVSRAAVLASLLPADFPRETFERLLGFGRPGKELVHIRRQMDDGVRVDGGFGCDRAFKAVLREKDLDAAHRAAEKTWGKEITVIDPMAGGGSIPLESARLGFRTLANEYNPVACSILEATVDYPFRFGEELDKKARKWAKVWLERIEERLAPFYPEHRFVLVHAYIFARTVPDPDHQDDADDATGRWHTPLVPDWHVLKPANHGECGPSCLLTVPEADTRKGTWRVARFVQGGRGAGQMRQAPRPTYGDGKGISLFTGNQIRADYIKAMAQQGRMKNALYAVALKTPQGLKFQPPEKADLDALAAAEKELARLRPGWEKANVIPTEEYPEVTSDERPRLYGMPRWADMFAPRQLLAAGVLVDELRRLRPEIVKAEGKDEGEAVAHLLAFALDKFGNHNCNLNRWESTRGVVKGKMDRHDFAFKPAFAELAPCHSGAGMEWAVENVVESYGDISGLGHHESAAGATLSMGSSTSLPGIADKSISAVVVDPPYTDNVQYSELADFFYVWLKRTQGHRRPEWFSTYLCDHDQEAVVNITRHRRDAEPVKTARARAHKFYQRLMAETFRECRRVLRDDGVLTVMFTHKKQEAWEALFTSLIQAGFTITATWPVKTESEHSLHQAKKNAAQSTVILVARKRNAKAGVGYFDTRMREEIRQAARSSAERLKGEGLNPVDQLVGSFGPAMEVYSRYDEVRTDTGDPVGVDKAIDEASDAVSRWRIEQLATRGLEGVEPEGQFALLCWDVLGAAEFRYNEAHLLGKAVGMDVDQLVAAGLVSKSGEKIKMLSARDRRRERALEPDEIEQLLFGTVTVPRKRTKKQVLKIHPNDPQFRTALDACHALALRYVEAKGGAAGVGSARGLARQQNWTKDSAVAKLMEALVRAAPEAVKFEKGKKSVAAMFPEFRAWHALLEPLFGVQPPEWKEKAPPPDLLSSLPGVEEEEEAAEDEEEGEGGEE